MKFEKELIELYGLILGDGHCRKGKYRQMTFCNSNLKLMKYIQEIIKKINGRTVRILKIKNRKFYYINIPACIRKKLICLGFNKERVPKWIFDSKFGINLLKALFEAEGSLNSYQIMIHQKYYKELLEECAKIANKFGLSAHVHKASNNRKFEYYLAIENTDKINKIFGRTIKRIHPRQVGKGRYYYTKRQILRILDNSKWLTTSQIREKLKKNDIDLSKKSKILVRKHLRPLSELGLVRRQKDKTLRDKRGCFIRFDSKWMLKRKLTDTQILNFPYSVVKK